MAKDKKKSKSKDKSSKKDKSKDKVKKSSKSSSKSSKSSKRTRKVIEVTPIKEKFTQSTLAQYLETHSGVERRQVKKILKSLEATVFGSLHRKGRGEFMWPGVCKFVAKDIPAKKGGEKKKNQFTGEMYVTKAKPATRKVKVRPMKKLKDAALA